MPGLSHIVGQSHPISDHLNPDAHGQQHMHPPRTAFLVTFLAPRMGILFLFLTSLFGYQFRLSFVTSEPKIIMHQ